jgi:hypothetical protein
MTIWRGGNPTLQNINLGMIKSLLTVNVFILFFLIILLGLYCVAPILRVFLQTSSNTTKRIFVISTISFGSIFYFFQYLYSLCTPANSLTYWLPYVGLFVAGYYIGNKHTLQKSKLILGIFCATLLITIGGDYLYYFLKLHENFILNDHGCLAYYSNSYLSINVVFMSLAAFALLINSTFDWIKNIWSE